MSYCSSCGSKYRNNQPSCRCGHHSHAHTHHNYPAPYYPHSHPNYCPTTAPCDPVIEGVLGRSINDGLWRVLDECGKPVPYAWVEVVYSGTTQKAPIGWAKDMRAEHLYPANPVQADHNGVIRLFYKGGPVDIIFYRNCNGAPGDVIDRILQVGGFEDGDFPLDQRPVVECIDIDNPLLSVYDKDNCNRPAFLATPLAIHIEMAIKAGLPTAKYSDVKKYFECLGEPWPDGVIVYGDCSDCPEIYIYKDSCPEECPPDPCNVTFNDGNSPCWIKCDLNPLFQCLGEDFPDASDACSITQLVLATTQDGCKKIHTYSRETARFPVSNFNFFTHNNFPANTSGSIPADLTDPSKIYVIDDLIADDASGTGTLDESKITGALLSNEDYEIDCDTIVEINLVLLRQVTNTITESNLFIRWSYDGNNWNYVRTASNGLVSIRFSSSDYRLSTDWRLSLTAGTVTIQTFLTLPSVGDTPTQVSVNSSPPPASGLAPLTVVKSF